MYRLACTAIFLLAAGSAHAQCVNVSASGGNDATAINAAFAASPSAPCVTVIGAVLTCGIITVPTNGMLRGNGMSSRLKRTCDGDMVRLMGNASLRDLYLDGQSDSFAGSAIVIEVESYQMIHGVGGYSRAPVIDFRQNCGGSNSIIRDFSFISWPDVNQYAVRLPANDGWTCGRRNFRDGNFNGGWGFDLSGGNSTIIDGVNIGAVRFKSDATGMTIGTRVINSRIANAADTVIMGVYHFWQNNITSSPKVRCANGVQGGVTQLAQADIWEYTTKTANGGSAYCRLHDSTQ